MNNIPDIRKGINFNELVKNNLYQRICEEHEFITVTQTSITSFLDSTQTEVKTWQQCKNCGLSHPIITQ